MNKKAVLYARVSSEEQAKGDAVSIESQLSDMRSLCERNGWQIQGTFIDCENYKASQNPKKGKVVSPSGERADRPRFLEMLDVVKSGAVDVVLCWRDDRLMRAPRVAVALEDALDLGDAARQGRGKIAIHEATGGAIDRFTLNIKAAVWREENRRRVERIKMGKRGTLAMGLWPGNYDRYGYVAHAVPGKRGRKIELGEPAEVETVANIFDWYDHGDTLNTVRKKLLASGAKQTGRRKQRHEWGIANISQILRAEDYAGVATWQFEDGPVSISIPAIVPHDQWERVQQRLKNALKMSTRKAGRVYILQHLTYCGECGGKVSPALKRTNYYRTVDGELRRYKIDPPQFKYRCVIAQAYPHEEHPRPYNFMGHDLEWAVWRYLVENGIKRPDLIIEQVQNRQEELIEQGESIDSDINRARAKLAEVDQERAFYQRQAARGTITEQEFDSRMAETADAVSYWREEIERLQELRDNAAKVQAGIDYATRLLQNFEQRLEGIDQTPEELAQLPEAEQERVLKERQAIVRALCDKIIVYSSGRIVIEGLLDGAEGVSFDLESLRSLCRR